MRPALSLLWSHKGFSANTLQAALRMAGFPAGTIHYGWLQMNAIEISNLIGLIYETASDESLWAQLLQRIAKNLDVPPDPSFYSAAHTPVSTVAGHESPADPALVLLACLAPHFAKA